MGGKVLGRSAKSWIKITIFYVIYYTFLGCLMYFSLGLYKNNLLDNYEKPKIRTRTDQPGMSAIPANNVHKDKLNKNFAFDPSKKESYESYVNEIEKFISKYDENVKKQFSPEVVKSYYEQGKILYFLRINKVIDWLPVGYNSAGEIAQSGYVDENQNPSLLFTNDFQSKGVYFFCNTTSDMIDFNFIPINVNAK